MPEARGDHSRPPTPRRRYHFGSPAIVYIMVTLLLALGAFNSQNNLLFWAFGFSLATLVVSGLVSGAMLMGIDVWRDRIDDTEAGCALTIRYRIRNRNRFMPAFALTIEELPVMPPPAPRSKRKRARAAAAAVTQPPPPPPPLTTKRIDQPRAFVAHIGPREQIVATCKVAAKRRGRIAFRAFVVHTSFPFGLIRKSLIYAEPAGAVIRPAPGPADTTLIDRALSTGDADRPGRIRGAGDEFHSLREYSPGDNPRSIAWKASARRGVLLVRQALAPAPTRLWVVLRLRIDDPPGADDELDERAISLAAQVIRHAHDLDLAIGLAVPLTRAQVAPRAQPGQSARLLHELGLIELGASDTRGLGEPFPRLSSGGAGDVFVCIHAGPVDHGFSPGFIAGPGGGGPGMSRRVVHLSATTSPSVPPPVPVQPNGTTSRARRSKAAESTPPDPVEAPA